jgi:hypothetical protein
MSKINSTLERACPETSGGQGSVFEEIAYQKSTNRYIFTFIR